MAENYHKIKESAVVNTSFEQLGVFKKDYWPYWPTVIDTDDTNYPEYKCYTSSSDQINPSITIEFKANFRIDGIVFISKISHQPTQIVGGVPVPPTGTEFSSSLKISISSVSGVPSTVYEYTISDPVSDPDL